MTGINDVELLAQANDPYDLFAFKINYTDVEVSGMNGVQPLYNGNISETFWRSYNDNVKRAYGYAYDDLNRMDEAFYQKPGLTAANINNYREKLTYDENGNILTLKRNGNLDNGIQEIEIDDLTYTYPQDSNQLLKVTDATLHPSGFEDDSTDGTLATDTTDDYAYDSMGNMTSDENKGIQEIKYNHLNLPTYIDLGGKGNILYIYDATGRKVRKLVQDDVLTQNKQVDYADGFQYENNILQFFPTAEGYASRLTTKIEQSGVLIKIPIEELPEDQFSYVYNYTDHLGNIRLSYSLDPDTQQLKIVEQNHYYPFGMRHTNYSGGRMVMVKDEELKRMAPATEEFLTYKYKYNGKEFQDELGLNLYDYGARLYDPSYGRWMSIDPLSEEYRRWSPYNYCVNNPMRFVDPDGMGVDDVIITGKFKQAAFEQLKASSPNLNMTMSDDGKVTATAVEGKTLTEAESTVLNATTDTNVTVNLVTTDKTIIPTSSGTGDLEGRPEAFGGSKVNADGTVTATQTMNPAIAEITDQVSGQKTGTVAQHAVIEAYTGAKDSPGAGDSRDSRAEYKSAHDKTIDIQTRSGMPINPAGAIVTKITPIAKNPVNQGYQITNRNGETRTLYKRGKK